MAGFAQELGPLGARRPARLPESNRPGTAQEGGGPGNRRRFCELRPSHNHGDGRRHHLPGAAVHGGQRRGTGHRPAGAPLHPPGSGRVHRDGLPRPDHHPHRRHVALLVERADVQRRPFQPHHLAGRGNVTQHRGRLPRHHHPRRAAGPAPAAGCRLARPDGTRDARRPGGGGTGARSAA